MKANIVLVGARGCGKTTVGHALAAQLGRTFVDLDAEIQQCEGRSIAQMVEQGGWEAFRAAEARECARYSKAAGLVVATGGGAVMNADNVRALKAGGVLVLLDASPELCEQRIAADAADEPNKRPSLWATNAAASNAEVHRQRLATYRRVAQVQVPVAAEQTPAKLAAAVLAAVQAGGDG